MMNDDLFPFRVTAVKAAALT